MHHYTEASWAQITVKHFVLASIVVIIVEGSETNGCNTVTHLFIARKSWTFL